MSKKIIDLGDMVACDTCNEDSHEQGGIVFSNKALCPACAKRMMPDIIKYNEEKYITARCPEDMTYHDWVINVLRDGKPGTIEVITGDDALNELEGW